jgi:hypothetical protein
MKLDSARVCRGMNNAEHGQPITHQPALRKHRNITIARCLKCRFVAPVFRPAGVDGGIQRSVANMANKTRRLMPKQASKPLGSATWLTILQQLSLRFSFASTRREFLTMRGSKQTVRDAGFARETPYRAIEFAAGRSSRATPRTQTRRAPAEARASRGARGPAFPTLRRFLPSQCAAPRRRRHTPEQSLTMARSAPRESSMASPA